MKRIGQLALACEPIAQMAMAETAPFAGQQSRGIATPPDQDVHDLFAGRGWARARLVEQRATVQTMKAPPRASGAP